MKIPKRRKVQITHHARKRLLERMPEVDRQQHRQIATAARYNGLKLCDITKSNPELAKRIEKKLNNNTVRLRVYKNHVFVFRGGSTKAHVLVTVIPLEHEDGYNNKV